MFGYLIRNRLRPKLGSRAWFKVWGKRILTFPSLLALGWRGWRWQQRGVTLGILADIGGCEVQGSCHRLHLGDFSFVGRTKIQLLDSVTIGNNVAVNDDVTILTGSHDVNDEHFQLLTKPVVAVKTVLAASTDHFNDHVSAALFSGGEMLVSLATTTLMFAALFKTLPDARLHWRDAWRGALVTSVLFSIGTTLIGLYLGHKTLDAFYGPGGSLVLLLLWVQYSAQVFFLGAAVTGELARRRGHAIEPDDHGVRIVIEEGL